MIAALYVDPRGPYPNMPGVECWDEARDARLYDGPHPVVAHPPCGRWSRLANLVQARWGHKVGADGGCFESALAAVRRWGGVLEHPAESKAWRKFGLVVPVHGAWCKTIDESWVCEVWQSAYGHRADKRTWLLFVGREPEAPLWGRPRGSAVISGAKNICTREERVWSHEARRTPPRFAEYLVRLARSASAQNMCRVSTRASAGGAV